MAFMFAAFAAFAVLMYLLYQEGIAVTKRITAVLFVFRTQKNRDCVSLDSCNGWAQRVVRFRESRLYEFHFTCQLSKGHVEVVLLDSHKRELLRLSPHKIIGNIKLSQEKRYYLLWEFQSSTGKCELRW